MYATNDQKLKLKKFTETIMFVFTYDFNSFLFQLDTNLLSIFLWRNFFASFCFLCDNVFSPWKQVQMLNIVNNTHEYALIIM
jgi:hypothetical protein